MAFEAENAGAAEYVAIPAAKFADEELAPVFTGFVLRPPTSSDIIVGLVKSVVGMLCAVPSLLLAREDWLDSEDEKAAALIGLIGLKVLNGDGADSRVGGAVVDEPITDGLTDSSSPSVTNVPPELKSDADRWW